MSTTRTLIQGRERHQTDDLEDLRLRATRLALNEGTSAAGLTSALRLTEVIEYTTPNGRLKRPEKIPSH